MTIVIKMSIIKFVSNLSDLKMIECPFCGKKFPLLLCDYCQNGIYELDKNRNKWVCDRCHTERNYIFKRGYVRALIVERFFPPENYVCPACGQVCNENDIIQDI